MYDRVEAELTDSQHPIYYGGRANPPYKRDSHCGLEMQTKYVDYRKFYVKRGVAENIPCFRVRVFDRGVDWKPTIWRKEYGTYEYVYLIWQSNSAYYKIGMSKNPEDRVLAIQRHHPKPVRLVALVETLHAPLTEAFFLQVFAPCRVHHEWFRFCDNPDWTSICFGSALLTESWNFMDDWWCEKTKYKRRLDRRLHQLGFGLFSIRQSVRSGELTTNEWDAFCVAYSALPELSIDEKEELVRRYMASILRRAVQRVSEYRG